MKAHGLLIWEGVIEDIDDPLEANRVRVRIFGLHSPNITQIPTEDLPWALVTDTGALSGIGQSPHWLKQGTTVNGYFRDGKDMQQPVVLGAILGIPQEKRSGLLSKGFTDPDGKYPLDDRIGEPDVSRLARGDISDSVLESRKNSVENSIPTPNGGNYPEPPTPFAATYPNNHVIESESGHIQEFDDTPDAERISLIHKKGTGFEVFPDGTRVDRVVGDNFEVIVGGNNVYIKGTCNITVDGDTNIKSGGKATVEAPKIDLGTEAPEPMVMGDKLKSWIENTLLTWANSHVHIGNLGKATSAPTKSLKSEDVYSKNNRTQE